MPPHSTTKLMSLVRRHLGKRMQQVFVGDVVANPQLLMRYPGQPICDFVARLDRQTLDDAHDNAYANVDAPIDECLP